MTTRARYLLAILSGVLLGLAFPPTGLAGGLLAFVALVPLLIVFDQGTRLRDAFKMGWVAMFVLGLVSNYWVGGWKSMSEVDPFLMVGGVLLAVVHPFFLIVPWLLYDFMRRHFGRTVALYSLPIFQAGFEYAHSFGDLAYPWLNLYNTQTYNLVFDQCIALTGPYFLSIVILIINVELFQIFFPEQKRHSKTIIPIGHVVALFILIAGPYSYGMYAVNAVEPSAPSIRVTIVQPNIDPWAKWYVDDQRILDTNFSATMTALRAVQDSTDLVIWPETAITFEITAPQNGYWLSELYRFLAQMHHPLLTGFPDRMDYHAPQDSIPSDAKYSGVDGFYYRSWNAAMLLSEDSNGHIHRPAYHKQKLVPLGEHVPFVQYFPFLGTFFQWGVGIGSWNYGEGYASLPLPEPSQHDTLRIDPAICYESVYPSFIRHFVDSGANLLAIITNDGWYGRSSGPYQHEQFAVLRAIENRRWIVRCANTGISAVIDDRGRYIKQLPLFVSGSITERVPLLEEKTLYTRFGDYVAIPSAFYAGIITVFAIGSRWRRKFKRRRARITTAE